MANTQAHQWKSRVKKVKKACLLVQATKDDIDVLNRYQQDAYGTVGISTGPQEAPTERPCHKCYRFVLPPNRVSDSTKPPLTPSTVLPTFFFPTQSA